MPDSSDIVSLGYGASAGGYSNGGAPKANRPGNCNLFFTVLLPVCFSMV